MGEGDRIILAKFRAMMKGEVDYNNKTYTMIIINYHHIAMF